MAKASGTKDNDRPKDKDDAQKILSTFVIRARHEQEHSIVKE